jgi:hypothetical protein
MLLARSSEAETYCRIVAPSRLDEGVGLVSGVMELIDWEEFIVD